MKNLIKTGAFAALGFLSLNVGDAKAQTVKVDADIATYQKTSGVTGNLNSIGSDTLNNLMTFWAEGFKAIYPNVNVQIEGKGSSTAPPALIEGTSQLGPMSRAMKAEEANKFEKRFGYKPTNVKVAIDALAVFVHKDNPVECLSTQQVDAIFSSTYKLGGQPINTWGDAGVTDPQWKNKAISLYGRNSASGTYGYFKKVVLGKGDYKSTVKEQPGSSSVVQGIASDLAGIGYSGIGYKTSGVKAISIKGKDGKCYAPNTANSLSGKYAIARFLYVYVNKKPGQSLDKLTHEFLKFVLSQAGQKIVVKDGYFPLPNSVVKKELANLK